MRHARGITVGVLLVILLAHGVEAGGLDVFETTLNNGLKVLLLEEHKAPVVTFQIWYRVGSRNEQPGRTGLAHFLEHMMFRRTVQIRGQEFARVIHRSGGRSGAFTSQDYTAYYSMLAANGLHVAVELESHRMANLPLDVNDVQRERNVVMEERRLRAEDDPAKALWEETQAAAFKAHPYSNPTVGWMEELRQLGLEDLRNFYRTYYAPNNAVVVVVGDFDRATLLPEIHKAFGAIPRGPEPPAVRSIEPPQTSERRVILRRPDAELPWVIAGYHVPQLTDPDSYALKVLEVILAGGKSARLHRHLVHEKQLALYAGASYTRISVDPELSFLYASVFPGKTSDEVERALYAEIDQLKAALVPGPELQKAKNRIAAFDVFEQDSVFSLAWTLGTYEMVGGWRHINSYLPGIRGVTPEDVRRVAQKYFTPQNRTVGILLPGKPPPPMAEPPHGTPAGGDE
jgi:zinc protease